MKATKPEPEVVCKICDYLESVFVDTDLPANLYKVAKIIAEHVAAKDAEIERLRAIVSLFPKTEDGVPIGPGMPLWTVSADTHMPIFLGQTQTTLDFIHFDILGLYSTREAAEAAMKGK
jgi:uncharacterized protein (UPF0147 family)